MRQESELDKFKAALKIIVNAPKEKKRKPKKPNKKKRVTK